MKIKHQFKKTEKLKGRLSKLESIAKTALQKVLEDFQGKAPKSIARAVRQEFNVPLKKISQARKDGSKADKKQKLLLGIA
ncbi:MAG: hypothetical protein LBC56_00445 [Oscillospiraceae bacterium]|nr:hypothetical protein [Oscillospiraceae bacterium]